MTTISIPYGRYSVVSQSGGHRTLQFSDTSWAQRPFPEGSITVSELNYENRFRGFAVVTPDLQIIRFKAATDSAIACLHALLTGDFEAMGLAYAVKSGNCWRCGRELTVPASIHRGMGPICSEQYSEAPKFTFKVPEHITLPGRPGAIVPPATPAPAPGVKPVTQQTLAEKLALRRPENQQPQRRKPGARAYMLSERMIAVEMDWGMLGFERVKNGIKALGFQWKTERRIWWTMLNPANADRISKALQDLGIEIDDEDVPAALYQFTEKQRTNRSAATATDADFEATGLREGMDLMPFQRAGVKQAVAVRSTIIADEMGLGKGLAHGTGVLTPDGYRSIESIRVDDLVIGRSGEPYRVNGVYPRGELPVYRVSFNDGTSVIVDEDHLWDVQHVRNGHRAPDRWQTMSVRELVEVGLHDSAGNATWRIPLVEPVYFPDRHHPIDPYLLGVLLGDGGISQHSVRFSTIDSWMVDAVQERLSAELTLKHTGGCDYAITSAGAGVPNPMIRSLKLLGLMGCDSHTKFVPEAYLYAPVDERLALLRGLMDTDGSARADGINEFCSVSPALADGVAFLVQSLGGIARRSVKALPGGGIAHRVNVKLDRCPFLMPRKAAAWLAPSKYRPSRIIKRIEPAGFAPVTCIAVDAPDQLFVTEHCIVTHNTVQALAAIAHLEAFPALVIVPASLKLNWKREIKRWVPDCEVAVLEGKNPKRARFPQRKAVIVVNYDILGSYDAKGNDGETQGWTESGWGRFLADVNWKAIVCDEAHYAKNPRAGRSKAVYELFRQNRTAIRLALTGTPVLNRPAELWPLISMLGYSNAFGGFNGYMKTYCNAYTGDYGYDVSGHANLADLNEALLSSGAMIRRRKEDVLLELPEKRWVTVPVVMGDGEKEYLKAEADCIRWFVELPARRERLRDKCWEEWQAGEGSRFDTFQEFFEASLRDSENKARMAQHLVRFEALKTAAWHAKRDSVYGWISEFLEGSDKKLIVFAHHREAVDALATKFNAVRIQGGMAVEQVEENKRLFQEDPRVRVIVCNIKAGGVGHTLTAASDVAFVEFPWTPADMDQAIDRAHRIGQRDSVTGWVLTAARSSGEDDPTIEDEIMMLLAEKRAVVEAITDGREMPEEMTSILGALTERWERRAAALAKQEGVAA